MSEAEKHTMACWQVRYTEDGALVSQTTLAEADPTLAVYATAGDAYKEVANHYHITTGETI